MDKDAVNILDFSGSSVVKDLPASVGDVKDSGSIPESGRSPKEGNGNPLQHSCLENSMGRGAWQATVRESQRIKHDLARMNSIYMWSSTVIEHFIPIFLVPLEESTVHATSLNIIKLKHRETVKISRAMLIMPEFFFK